MSFYFELIGTIYTPFLSEENMPIQPAAATKVEGKIIIREDLVPALSDLDGFSHIILIYYFHKSKGFDHQVVPFLDTVSHGLFATRAPRRPNAIGLSVVRLVRIEGNVLFVENVDMLNETPLLDIKPYVSAFDNIHAEKCGWLDKKSEELKSAKSDKRFGGSV